MVDDTSIGGPGREFPETQWSKILSARDATEARRSLVEDLVATYWKPLYGHARRKGLKIEDAKDAIQGFVTQLLERDFLERLDPSKGRFRSYLKASLDNFLATLHEQRIALKRGGGRRIVSLDFDVAEDELAASGGDADAAYDREWALAMVARARDALRREFEEGRWSGSFDVVLQFLRPGEMQSYAEAAAACGKTVPQFKMFIHRARSRFRQLVRDEVARTVESPEDVDAELETLLRVLST